MKLTIEQLKNYLGTGLMMQYEGFGENREQIIENWTISSEEFLDINFKSEFSNNEEDVLFYFKPICYRLSDLDKFIPELGFVPIEELLKIATEQIWGGRIEPVGKPEILTNGDSTGIIAWNETERVSFTLDKEYNWFDFNLYVDGAEMKLDKFHLFQKLFQWHFWPFGDEYFEQGLVIDKLKMTEK